MPNVDVTAELPPFPYRASALPVLTDYVRRANRNAVITQEAISSAPIDSLAMVSFEVPDTGAQEFAEALRSIGFLNIKRDGQAHISLLEPANGRAELATPVQYKADGAPQLPLRLVVEHYAGSSRLECGHFGPRYSGDLKPNRRTRCQNCLPLLDRLKHLHGSTQSWIEEETGRQLRA